MEQETDPHRRGERARRRMRSHADRPAGAVCVSLQRTDLFIEIATAWHGGHGNWERVYALGRTLGQSVVPGCVRLQVSRGAVGAFDDVILRIL
jgi:hypothetical protein